MKRDLSLKNQNCSYIIAYKKLKVISHLHIITEKHKPQTDSYKLKSGKQDQIEKKEDVSN